MRILMAGMAFLIAVTSCTKEFKLDPGQLKHAYVIEGRISNLKGPYYVRVTQTMDPVQNRWHDGTNYDTATPVTNARVIISDEFGVTDTLIPSTNWYDGFLYRINTATGDIDSIYLPRPEIYTTRERGYYQTTKLQGVAGRTYHLRVEIGDEVFTASAFMPPVPPLEHAEFRDTTVSPFTNTVTLPIAYFKDPPGETNYYLLKNQDLEKYRSDRYFDNSAGSGDAVQSQIDFYFFDDKLLVPGLNAVPARVMIDPTQFEQFPDHGLSSSPMGLQVRLCSLNKEAYEFIRVISRQIMSDGNIYKPAPATPPGNIKGALGLFFASEISDKLILP